MKKEYPNKRQHPRFTVGGPTKGQVTATCEASLLNISLGGALIEHAEVVRPGTITTLDLPILGRVLRVRCRVTRSGFTRQEKQPDGEFAMIYHTGLQFLDLPEETQSVINEYIQSISEGGQTTDGRAFRRSYTCEQCGESFELTDREVCPVFIEPRKRPVQSGDLFDYKHGMCEGTLMYTGGGPNVPWFVEEEA